MNKKTKIVATVGPSSDSPRAIEDLMKKGVDVFRFNMKHADVHWHGERIDIVKNTAKKLSKHIGVLVDLQGPEMRISTPEGEELTVRKGQEVLFTDIAGLKNSVHVPYGFPKGELKKGDRVLIDDGIQEFEVTKKSKKGVYAMACENYVIEDHKGLNVPEMHIELPSLTRGDKDRLKLAKKKSVDFVALSFCRSKEDIRHLRSQMKKINLEAMVVAKVESREALEKIDEIIEEADALMVARGDLGVEVPFEEIAYWQNVLLQKCRAANTPVIVATQMLESMRKNPRPTRAEVTDVANAVLHGTDAVMLSGETAFGQFPSASVDAMRRIVMFNEGKALYIERSIEHEDDTELIVDAAIAMLKIDHGPHIDALLVFTETGFTARVAASYRPNVPIVAVTDREESVGGLTLSYGVTPFLTKFPVGLFSIPTNIINELVGKGLLRRGNTILVVHGEHWRKPGQTNAVVLMRV